MPHCWKSYVAAHVHVYNNTISADVSLILAPGTFFIILLTQAIMILMSSFQHACGARGLIVALCIHLLPYLLCISNESSDETAHLRRFVRAFAA